MRFVFGLKKLSQDRKGKYIFLQNVKKSHFELTLQFKSFTLFLCVEDVYGLCQEQKRDICRKSFWNMTKTKTQIVFLALSFLKVTSE